MEQKWYETSKFLGGVIIFLSVAVYARSLSGNFVWDDKIQIVENAAIKDARNIPLFFSSDLRRLIDSPARASYYFRPLFLLSLALDYHLWGLNPVGYHITNLILHAAATFLVYQVSGQIFSCYMAAFLASMLFAVHPIHVESIAWISGRTDPLATVFFLLSFYFYILYSKKGRISFLVFSLTTYVLSLLSKEIAITFPLLLLGYEVSSTLIGKPTSKRINPLPVIGLYILVSGVYFYMRTIILGEAVGSLASSTPSLGIRIYSSFGIILDYIRIMVFPINLKVLYDVPFKDSFFDGQVLIAGALLTAILALSVLSYRLDWRIFFSCLWFFITILPVSNIVVPLRPTPMAERYMYLSSVGVCMLGGLILGKAYRVIPRWSTYLRSTALVLFTLLSFITYQRNGLWKNDMIFFSKMTEDAPSYVKGHYVLGGLYREKGDIKRAIAEWAKVLSLDPLHSEANNNLGNIALLKGDYPDAIRRYKTAITGDPKNAEAHYNLGAALEEQGQTDEAVFHYREFIAMAPVMYSAMREQVMAHVRSLEMKNMPKH